MAGKYKTMILIDSICKWPGRYRRVCECRVCHGVLPDGERGERS